MFNFFKKFFQHYLITIPTLINSSSEGIRVIGFYSWKDFVENLIKPLIIAVKIDVQ
jgi:hypothetical protein